MVALRRFRPDLSVVTADVEPTGLAIVTQLDPTNRMLFDRFDEIVNDIDQPAGPTSNQLIAANCLALCRVIDRTVTSPDVNR